MKFRGWRISTYIPAQEGLGGRGVVAQGPLFEDARRRKAKHVGGVVKGMWLVLVRECAGA